MISIVKSWLAHAISSMRTWGDNWLRILVPADAIVRKSYTDTVNEPVGLWRGYVVHRIRISLPVAKGVLENSTNYLRIASESRVPCTGSFGQYQYRTGGRMRGHIDRLIIDCIRILRRIVRIDSRTAPPYLPHIPGFNYRRRIVVRSRDCLLLPAGRDGGSPQPVVKSVAFRRTNTVLIVRSGFLERFMWICFRRIRLKSFAHLRLAT